MIAVQRFVQLAQADAAPSSTLFPARNHHPSVFWVHSLVFAGAVRTDALAGRNPVAGAVG
jgi:hypothetical protein